ncbi:MAG: M20/M25/M40 family metallo-hydrolase [Candidatus Sumerlaeia bacterium]
MATHERIAEAFAAHEDELIELHRELVRIPTVNPAMGGEIGERPLTEFAARWLAERGIEARQIEGNPSRSNLVAEIGEGDRTILWMSHSDVVPAGEESSWQYPPFAAELAEGRIWGRGSNDCKMLVASQLFALARLKGLGLGGRIRLAVGADEETGGLFGFGYLARKHEELLKADLALCEGGGSSLGMLGGKVPINTVSAADKGKYVVVFRAGGDGGHASSPWGHSNPLLQLTRLVGRIEKWDPPVSLKAPILKYARKWAGMKKPIGEDNLEKALGKIARIAPGLSNSLRGQTRNTFTPTMFQSGVVNNVLPTEATLTCDVRTLPGIEIKKVKKIAARLIEGLDGVEFEIIADCPPSISKVDKNLCGLFEKSATLAVGKPVEIVPTWCIGATDARYVRDLGTPVYGFQLIHPDADKSRLSIHCIDESIEARMLLPCAQAIAHFAAEYFGANS